MMLDGTKCYSLGSGSSGNCYFIGSRRCGLLVDAGLSTKEIESRLKRTGNDLSEVNGLFLTHEHIDHSRSAGTLARKLNIPIFLTQGTAGSLKQKLRECCLKLVKTGDGFDFVAGIKVRSFAVSHDAEEPVGYSFSTDDGHVAIVTDTGEITSDVYEELERSDIVFLEANHDVESLLRGPYPEFLKRRIMSRTGHLSNHQAAEALSALSMNKQRIVMLAHLSEKNNSPSVAFRTVKESISNADNIKVGISYRDQIGMVIRIKSDCLEG